LLAFRFRFAVASCLTCGGILERKITIEEAPGSAAFGEPPGWKAKGTDARPSRPNVWWST